MDAVMKTALGVISSQPGVTLGKIIELSNWDGERRAMDRALQRLRTDNQIVFLANKWHVAVATEDTSKDVDEPTPATDKDTNEDTDPDAELSDIIGDVTQDAEDDTTPGLGHNNPPTEPDVGDIVVEKLQAFVSRIEGLLEEKDSISADIREIYAEAKGVGFDTKTMRQVIRLKKMDKIERDEAAHLIDLYLTSLGL